MSLELARALAAFDAGGFVARHGGRKESRSPRSGEYLLHCPRCGGHNLRWNAGKGSGVYQCWNCYDSGDTLKLVQQFERCDREQAMGIVLDGYVGGDARLDLQPVLPRVVPLKASARRMPAIELPIGCVPSSEHPVVRQYLRSRGIDEQLAAYWGLYAGTRGALSSRVIFPVHMDGALVYYQARAAWDPPQGLSREDKRAWISATKFRKTLNPFVPCYAPGRVGPEQGVCADCRRAFDSHPPMPAPGRELATAGEVLFNYDRAKTSAHVVVVEGPVDAIKVGPHAVALLGKGTDEKVRRLRLMSATRYTVYLDRGEQERAAALQIASALSGYAKVYLCEPPEGYDAGALTPAQNAEVLSRAQPLSAQGLRSELRL